MRMLWPILLITVWLAGCGARDAPPKIRFEQASSDQLVHGARVAGVLGCTGCHGADLTGHDWSEPGFGRLWTANLTRTVPGYTDAELDRVIRSGTRSDREMWGMPSHLFTQIAPGDMAAVIAFLRSKPAKGETHPAPEFEEGGRREIAMGMLKSSRTEVAEQGILWPPEAGEGHDLGRYIVRATCAECHGLNLRGGTPYPGAAPRPDIRIAASYDPAQFERLLRTGIAPGERELGLMSEVARGRYSHFTDSEIEAVHRYLKAVAKVDP